MTGASWATYAGGSVAVIALCGFLWRKVLRPLAHGIARLGELLDRLFEVLDGWPDIQANVLATQTQLTELSIQLGEVGGRLSNTRDDVDTAFDRIRALEADRHRHPQRRALHEQPT